MSSSTSLASKPTEVLWGGGDYDLAITMMRKREERDEWPFAKPIGQYRDSGDEEEEERDGIGHGKLTGGSSEIVTFIVGPNQTNFTLPRSRVYETSPVFKAAFNSPLTEGQTQTYELLDVSTELFTIYGTYLKTSYFSRETIARKLLHKFYTFTNRFLMEDLKFLTLYQLVFNLRLPGELQAASEDFQAVYKHHEETGEGSALRHLYVGWCAKRITTDELLSIKDNMPSEMVWDLAVLGNVMARQGY